MLVRTKDPVRRRFCGGADQPGQLVARDWPGSGHGPCAGLVAGEETEEAQRRVLCMGPGRARMPSSFCRVSAQEAPGEGAGLAGQWRLLVARLTGMSLVLRDRGFRGSRDAPGPTGSWR